MQIELQDNFSKSQVFKTVNEFLEKSSFTVIDSDSMRPWGGFYVIDEQQSNKFIDFFFSDVPMLKKQKFGKLSPKILIVEKGKRLSWQYHHRRAEIWKVIAGEVAVVTSETDSQNEPEIKKAGSIITLKQGERHRLIGLENWGVIAEIWQHTDQNEPSNEEDIVRVQDDFGR
jgi:mannose-6-phosphate isomerase